MAGAWIIGGAMVLSTVIAAVTAPKPPKAPDTSAFDNAAIQQARQAADTSSTDQIKIAQNAAKRGGVQAPDTLLTGPGGIDDDEVNLGGNLLA